MENNIRKILATSTLRQSAISSGATVVNGALGVIFYILMARSLSPEQFGVFSIAILTSTMLSDIANVGTDTGIVRFVGKYFHADWVKAMRFLKFGLEVKLVASLVVLLAGWLIVPFFATNILQKPELTTPLRVSLLGSVGMLLFSFTTSSLQAMQKFGIWAGLNIGLNTSRLIIVSILMTVGSLSVISGLAAYILIPIFGFFVGLMLLPRFLRVKGEKKVGSEFLHYNKWVAIFIVIAAISARLDSYIVAKFLDLEKVGIYSVATGLSAIASQIVAGIATVVAPKISGFTKKSEYRAYFRKLHLFVGVLAVTGVIAGLLVAPILIPAVYGQEYLGAVEPLFILIIAQAIFLFSIPVHASVFYYFSKPRLFVYISSVNLLIIAVLGWQLIGLYGYMGAAMTVLVGNISNFVIPAVWVYRENRRK